MEWISFLLVVILVVLSMVIFGIGLLVLSVGWMDRM